MISFPVGWSDRQGRRAPHLEPTVVSTPRAKVLLNAACVTAGLAALATALVSHFSVSLDGGGGGGHERETVTAAPAAAALEPAEVNLGDLRQRATAGGEFRLTNVSAAPLQLSGLETTCGCTVAPDGLIGRLIPPGESLAVPVTFDAGLKDGESRQRLTVEVRDAAETRTELRGFVAARVAPDFRLDPPVVEFGVVEPGEAPARRVRIERAGDRPVRLISAESARPGLRVEDAGDGGFTVVYEGADDWGGSVYRGAVRLTLRTDRTEERTVDVLAQPAPAAVLSPRIVTVAADAPPGPAARTVVVTPRAGVTVESVDCDHPGVAASLRPADADGRVEISLVLADIAAGAPTVAAVELRLRLPTGATRSLSFPVLRHAPRDPVSSPSPAEGVR